MVKVGIIGYGYWGPNLVRNFISQSNCKIVQIADMNADRLVLVKRVYPGIDTTSDIDEILNNPELDAVVIATPVFTHYQLALKALNNGKHVLIEKPMTSSSAEAVKLHQLAQQKGLTLMVDHTFLYTGAVQKMKNLIDSGTIGKPLYFDSTRINLGLFQPDINVLWDLAPHDLSILLHLIDEKPVSVNATGISHTGNGIENIAYMTVNFNSGFIAHFNCSWSSPVKVRSTLIGGDKKMIFYNDLEPTEKVKIYDSGYKYSADDEKNRILVDYRIGDIFIPKLPTTEALSAVASDFLSSIVNGTTPVADSILGCEVVKILEAAQDSIKNKGQEIKIGN
jgi:predicted dehydrogenase